MSRVVAGFEASKTTLDVHAVGEEHRFANDDTNRPAPGSWLRSLGAMEAASRCQRRVHPCRHDRGLAVVHVNPLRSRRRAEVTGVLAKAGRGGARMPPHLRNAPGDLEPVAPQGGPLIRLEDSLMVREKLADSCAMLARTVLFTSQCPKPFGR